MKMKNFTGFSIALLSLASFIVCAGDDYSPAEYKPKDIYSEQDIHSSSVVMPETTPKKPQNADVEIKHEVIPTVTHYKESNTHASKATDDVQSEKPSPSSSIIIFIAALLAMGIFFFRRKLIRAKSLNNSSSSSVYAVQGSTGVERYIEKLVVRKTGVEKYLERQTEIIPATGVAKYMAKQVVRGRLNR